MRPADLLDLVAYERQRPDIRESAMAARRLRRVTLGPMVSLGFENTETVRYQIQEMMRAERMVEANDIQTEIDIYSDLLPGPTSLAATMFIEIDDPPRLREVLPRLVGIEQAVSLAIDGAGRVPARGEEGRSKEDLTSTVHYLRFFFEPDQIEAMRSGAACTLHMDHAEYAHTAPVPADCVKALLDDLGPPG